MTPSDMRSRCSLDSGPLVITQITRNCDGSGVPLDTFAVTMAGSTQCGPVTITQEGVSEALLRIFMEADAGECVLSLCDIEGA